MVFDKQSFKWEMKKRKDYIDANLMKFLDFKDAYPPVIHEAMKYAVLNGGKRLRPILVLEGAGIAGGARESVASAACAIEIIHTYSLVHDDLPAMDDDDYRRGNLTCHKVYGEANAILTGDALLTMAFELLAGNRAIEGIDPMKLLLVIEEISKAIGSRGMIGGQVVDLESEGQSIEYHTLKNMHSLKTGELFKAAIRTGAILCGIEDRLLEPLDRFACHFGLAFQITDDILDIRGSQTLIGKPVGSDIKNGKTTYPSIFGMDKSLQLARESVGNCLDSLEVFGDKADFLRNLAYSTIERDS